MAKVRITVNDDAPEDLALNGTPLAAGETYEIDRTHLAALAAYATVAEEATPDAKAAPAPAALKAAAKKGKR